MGIRTGVVDSVAVTVQINTGQDRIKIITAQGAQTGKGIVISPVTGVGYLKGQHPIGITWSDRDIAGILPDQIDVQDLGYPGSGNIAGYYASSGGLPTYRYYAITIGRYS